MFEPCIIIPLYNHGKLLKSFIDGILLHKVPIIIIDDGSDLKTKEIAKDLAKNELIINYILEKNSGKGAAVIYGFKEAYKLGFTHALQIDADGQHDSKDIKEFLELSKHSPQSLINGCPIFDETVPKSRLYGRKFTNFWVNVETLSFDIKDSMCGFRVYPLQKTLEIDNIDKISPRMGFDIEIIVKIFWNNITIINKYTKVEYPDDGRSNFKLIRDNFQISLLHSKLFFSTVWRIILFPITLSLRERTKTKGKKLDEK